MLNPGDRLSYGPNKKWYVDAVCLGALNQESVIKLLTIGRDYPHGKDGKTATIYCPVDIIKAALDGGYLKLDTNEAGEL